MKSARLAVVLSVLACSVGVGCTANAPAGDDAAADVADLTSNDGKTLDFSFDAEVLATADGDARQAVVAQLQYVQGTLTSDVRGNAQVGLVQLKNVRESVVGDKKRIQYSAVLPVVWPKETATPRDYKLTLPKDASGLDAFNAKYDGSCGKNEYGAETFWHDFNPKTSGCRVASEDAITTKVNIAPSAQASQGKYPEYDQVLADDSIDVVGVFGIISSNTPDDEGAREMENVIVQLQAGLTDAVRKDSEATASVIRSTVVTGTVNVAGKARQVSLTALLTSELAAAGSDFDAIYGPASAKADLVVYSGHSGLGKNINALAAKTVVTPGKYQMFYLNGCQSFAYLGRGLHDKKIAANGAESDPNGTRYLDVVANALPSYGDNGDSSLLLYRALLEQDAPKSYNDLLRSFSRVHLSAAFGEEDNTFRPR